MVLRVQPGTRRRSDALEHARSRRRGCQPLEWLTPGAGLGALLALTVRGVRHGQDLILLPAVAAALLWLFATGKVYSVQYSLWILLALALAGLPLRAMIAVSIVDVFLFVTLWGGLPWLGEPWPGTLLIAVRQALTALLAVWVMARIASPDRDRPLAAGAHP